MDELWSIVTLEFIATDDELRLARLLGQTADSDTTWAENEVLSVARLAVNEGTIVGEPTSSTEDDSNIEDTNGNEDTFSFLAFKIRGARERCKNGKVEGNTRKREHQSPFLQFPEMGPPHRYLYSGFFSCSSSTINHFEHPSSFPHHSNFAPLFTFRRDSLQSKKYNYL